MEKETDTKTDDIETATYIETMNMSGGPVVWIVLLVSYLFSTGYDIWIGFLVTNMFTKVDPSKSATQPDLFKIMWNTQISILGPIARWVILVWLGGRMASKLHTVNL